MLTKGSEDSVPDRDGLCTPSMGGPSYGSSICPESADALLESADRAGRALERRLPSSPSCRVLLGEPKQ